MGRCGGSPKSGGHWEHFAHAADIGVRGCGSSLEQAFEQGAMALTAAITDPEQVKPEQLVTVQCEAPDRELLFVEWLNTLIYEMATRNMLFSRFRLKIEGNVLRAEVYGEGVDLRRHEPAVEAKGATYTELYVGAVNDGPWVAQCVVDV
ncbi:MAG: archease [Gammaproteobacteria bacterium]|nr:archease [Gammaproteobacteria bacterium]